MSGETIGWVFTVLWFGYWAVVSAVSLIIGVTLPPVAVIILARTRDQARRRRERTKRRRPSPRTGEER